MCKAGNIFEWKLSSWIFDREFLRFHVQSISVPLFKVTACWKIHFVVGGKLTEICQICNFSGWLSSCLENSWSPYWHLIYIAENSNRKSKISRLNWWKKKTNKNKTNTNTNKQRIVLCSLMTPSNTSFLFFVIKITPTLPFHDKTA